MDNRDTFIQIKAGPHGLWKAGTQVYCPECGKRLNEAARVSGQWICLKCLEKNR